MPLPPKVSLTGGHTTNRALWGVQLAPWGLIPHAKSITQSQGGLIRVANPISPVRDPLREDTKWRNDTCPPCQWKWCNTLFNLRCSRFCPERTRPAPKGPAAPRTSSMLNRLIKANAAFPASPDYSCRRPAILERPDQYAGLLRQ